MSMKDVGDVAAASTAVGTYFHFLPEVAALFAIIWTSIRIYEWFRMRVLKIPSDGKME